MARRFFRAPRKELRSGESAEPSASPQPRALSAVCDEVNAVHAVCDDAVHDGLSGHSGSPRLRPKRRPGLLRLRHAAGGVQLRQKLLPRRRFQDLYFALDLNDPSCPTPLAAPSAPARRATQSTQLPAGAVFVAPSGDDGAAGSEAAPLRSIQAACDLAARTSRVVVLRGGTHFLASTITLTAAHSHLRIMPYPGESPVVSGGKELQVAWEAHDVANGKNIWKADISGQVADVPGLQLDGVRATRARYPNLPGGIEVSPGYDAMIFENDATWTPPQFDRFGNVTFFTDARPDTLRNVTPDDWFQRYMIGVGGLCSVYDPPVSYWCSEHPSGGGAFAFRTPSGVTPKAGILPNAPYKDVSRAILNVWRPNRWANWMFEVGGYNATTNNFTFGKGGFQGARGNDNGGDWFIENVFEELDNPGEFFFDADAGELYLYHNGTGAPPKSASVVAPQLKVLLNMSGTQWAPVRNVSVTGITYTAAAYTYMEPHGVPSAGDWALERFASVYLYGTEGVTFDGCTFERLDGNGIMVSGYNRNASIEASDFAFLGGNAIAAWGYTNETSTDPGRPGVRLANAPAAGVDGTDGEHPRFTTVRGCSAREVGLYEKQSSFFVQAKTAQSVITGNVFFNGPRAGINANDGFGGGDVSPTISSSPPAGSRATTGRSTRGIGSHSSRPSVTARPRCAWRGGVSITTSSSTTTRRRRTSTTTTAPPTTSRTTTSSCTATTA